MKGKLMYIIYERNSYMSHETSPPPQLSNMKMPKVKPISKLENSNFICSAK